MQEKTPTNPPPMPELEKSVLGDLVLESTCYHPHPLKGVVGMWDLRSEHFVDSTARAAFDRLMAEPSADTTVRFELLSRSHGVDFAQMVMDVTSVAHGAAEDHIRRLAERARKRIAAEGFTRLFAMSENCSEDYFMSELTRLARAAGERAPTLASVALEDFLATPPATLDPIVADCFERGDKVELIAPSKCRKSFFALDLALHVAVGWPFCGLAIPKPRKVLLVNLEIKCDWMKRRVISRMRGYGFETAALGGRLSLMNCRGQGGSVRDAILARVQALAPDLVILDPRYKLMRPDEDENSGNGLIGILNLLDAIAECGAAVLIVSHDKKGDIAAQDIRDRGAGSNWAARDVDCRFVITPDKKDANLLSVGILARNYPPRRPLALRVACDRFSNS